MYIQVNKSMFMDQFRKMDRMSGWTYQGLSALFDYLEECEAGERDQYGDAGEELDVVALCCSFDEHASLQQYNDCYGTEHESIDDIADITTVIKIDDTSFIAGEF